MNSARVLLGTNNNNKKMKLLLLIVYHPIQYNTIHKTHVYMIMMILCVFVRVCVPFLVCYISMWNFFKVFNYFICCSVIKIIQIVYQEMRQIWWLNADYFQVNHLYDFNLTFKTKSKIIYDLLLKFTKS